MSNQMVKPGAVNTVRELLEKSRAQIAIALPRHLTPERMIRVAITALQRTPALQECGALSILGGVIQASELGLELTGPLGQAYLVPYWNKNTKQKEAQFQVGYRGLMDLAYRSGRVETFTAHAVRQNDNFRFLYGTNPKLEHVPEMTDPGEIVAVYAVVRLKGGGHDFEVMSTQAVNEHRKKYSKQTSDYSPWETAWEEMAKKTVIRKLAKRVPLSVELATAAAMDEYAEAGLSQNLETLPALPAPDGNGSPPVGKSNLRDKNGSPEPPPGEQGAQADEDPPAAADITADIEDELRRTGLAGTLQVDEMARAAGAERFHGIKQGQAEKMLAELRNMPTAEEKQQPETVPAEPQRRFARR